VNLINSVIAHESKGMWNAVSNTGALGVMQITADNYAPHNGVKFNPFDPEKSIMHGTKMLSFYIDKFGSNQLGIDKSLVAYNQGKGAVSRAIDKYKENWLENINEEGRNYIIKIHNIRNNGQKIPGYFGERR